MEEKFEIEIDYSKYINFCKPNIFRSWVGENGQKGIIIGNQNGKYTVWSVLYIINEEKRMMIPTKINTYTCKPIMGSDYDKILKTIQ